jgi:hypothetical protein
MTEINAKIESAQVLVSGLTSVRWVTEQVLDRLGEPYRGTALVGEAGCMVQPGEWMDSISGEDMEDAVFRAERRRRRDAAYASAGGVPAITLTLPTRSAEEERAALLAGTGLQIIEPRVHDLKCWPEYFAAVVDGTKRFEIRENDRGFRVGGFLRLREWNPTGDGDQRYTGREVTVRVLYVFDGKGVPGLVDGYVIMSIEVVP